jgi:hypothetical protein
MIDQGKLRLSAQRALLGRIHSEMRLVKIKAEERSTMTCQSGIA